MAKINPRLTYQDGRFHWIGPFELRGMPQAVGFCFDRRWGWHTGFVDVAARLREIADDAAKKEIYRRLIIREPWTGGLVWPSTEMPKRFQQEGAIFALERNRSYLAAEMGLGKTIMACLVQNAMKGALLYVCPPYMVTNVRAEFDKWLMEPDSVVIATDNFEAIGDPAHFKDYRVIVVPDNYVSWLGYKESITRWTDYHRKAGTPTLLVIDEAQRYQEEKTLRTGSLFLTREREDALIHLFDRVVFLSGTPITKRIMDLFTVLYYAAPQVIGFRSRAAFGQHYCGAKHNGFGWKYEGATNLDELQRNLRQFMLRIWKKDVLPELPPMHREMVFIGEDLPPQISAIERELLLQYSPEDLLRGIAENNHVATYRKMLGLYKVEAAAQYIRGILDDTGEKVLLFGIHTVAIEKMTAALAAYNPLVITGQVGSHKRHPILQEFASKADRPLLIANVEAGGVGHNATAARRVIFFEWDWVVGKNQQAEGRVHRIGQTRDCLSQYLAYRNSIDRRVMEKILREQEIINRI